MDCQLTGIESVLCKIRCDIKSKLQTKEQLQFKESKLTHKKDGDADLSLFKSLKSGDGKRIKGFGAASSSNCFLRSRQNHGLASKEHPTSPVRKKKSLGPIGQANLLTPFEDKETAKEPTSSSDVRPDSKATSNVKTKRPTIYKLISNIGYSIEGEGEKSSISFRCFYQSCRSAVVCCNTETFALHLETAHKDEEWNRYCIDCQGLVSPIKRNEAFDEFLHVKSFHAAHLYLPDQEIYHNLNVQPWLRKRPPKNSRSADLMVAESSLVSNYKCMAFSCEFTSNCSDHFKKHLSVQHKHVLDGSGKCAYCEFKVSPEKDHNELIYHIQVVHKYDRYQCKYCFYRCASINNSVNHTITYHPGKLVIVLDMQIPTFLTEPKSREKASRNLQTFVPKMKCQHCSKSFYLVESYLLHLRKHREWHQKATHCKDCSLPIALNNIEAHLQSCHSISIYQCLHCLFGTDQVVAIVLHLADKHPTKYPHYCSRLNTGQVWSWTVFARIQHFQLLFVLLLVSGHEIIPHNRFC